MVDEIVIQSRLSPELFDTLFNSTSEASVKKGDTLLKQGEVCRYIYIIGEGLLRMYYFDKKGNDITHWFAREKELMTAPKSFSFPSFINNC